MMDVFGLIKELPSTAFRAIRDYFSGLHLFFNWQTWSHGTVFILTIIFFGAFQLIQPVLRLLYAILPGDLPLLLLGAGAMVFWGGCGAFIGFLLLGLIAILPTGQYYLYKSRARHLISPAIIGGMFLFFSQIIPRLLKDNDFLRVITVGTMQELFNFCWLAIVLLQVAVMAYTVVKGLKWLWGYARVPEHDGRAKSSVIAVILLLVLIPIAIWFWIPVLDFIMFGFEPHILPTIPDELPWFVGMLLKQSPLRYRYYLFLICPLVVLIPAIALWRRYPQVSLALAGFGAIYPALVYYYRFRVDQYFMTWRSMTLGEVPHPYIGAAMFEMFLVLITFLMVLQGVAKLQKNISPNPFGLFALMTGALLAALIWFFNPTLGGSTIWWNVETFSMVSAALSAFFAVFIFATIPLIYCIYRFKRHTHPPTSTEMKTEELS